MQIYNKYLVTKRYKKLCQCGEVNLPYGTECNVVNRHITCNDGIICYVESQDAFDFFSQNDDGNGIERGKLVHLIVSYLRKLNQKPKQKAEVWDKIWNDSLCQKYKRPEHIDSWLWNYDFYNANLHDLQYIAKLVGAK